MLKISQLETLCEEYKAEKTAIKDTLLLVDDDDYGKFVKDKVHTKEEAILIAVLPSVNTDFKDLDNYKHIDNLHFFIIQKADEKAGYEGYVNTFKFCQELILDFESYLIKRQKTDSECVFKHFDFQKLTIDPVVSLARTHGYSLTVPLKTKR